MSEESRQRHALPDPFTIACQRDGDTARIRVTGELDIATVGQLRAQCEREHHGDARIIVIDLSGVTFMDSAGAAALFAAHEASGKRLQIILSAPSARVIDITEVRGMLPIIAG